MASEIDVLILFAANDDHPDSENRPGWVSQFKRFLGLMLNQVLGERTYIMSKSDVDSHVAPDLDNVGIIVTVLSPEFVDSQPCLDNVKAFYERNGAAARNRVFKVFKSPLPPAEQPQELRDLLSYDMYLVDPDSGEVRQYTDYFNSEAETQYWMKMVDLTYDIYDGLNALKSEGGATVRSLRKRKTIYLAETGHDLSIQRNIIKRELQRHGYVVLPNQALPAHVGDLERLVKRDLEECQMSIHLIGNVYGDVPEGTDRSVLDIQNRLAAEKSILAKQNHEEFSRLIWISPDLSNASERQKSFIENIKRDVEAQEGAEILQTPLEDFKNIMREELVESEDRKPVQDIEGLAVYLMHDRVDVHDVKPIREALEDAGFHVLLPEFEGELLEVRKKHIDHLKNFDAAIIYQGNVNDQWVRMKALDLMKAPGFGRKKPIMGKAILTTRGLNIEEFQNQNLQIIEANPNDAAQSVKAFLREFIHEHL